MSERKYSQNRDDPYYADRLLGVCKANDMQEARMQKIIDHWNFRVPERGIWMERDNPENTDEVSVYGDSYMRGMGQDKVLLSQLSRIFGVKFAEEEK